MMSKIKYKENVGGVSIYLVPFISQYIWAKPLKMSYSFAFCHDDMDLPLCRIFFFEFFFI